ENRPCVLEVDVKTTDLFDSWANNLTSEVPQLFPCENNCFLNVIIQSFWHLVPLRRLLLDVTIKDLTASDDEKANGGGETQDGAAAATNVLKTLKATMMSYEDPSSGSLHPKELRQGLSLLYKT
ncbi:hypothetical protein DYB31_007613, partial [Aphanomyces astaci]